MHGVTITECEPFVGIGHVYAIHAIRYDTINYIYVSSDAGLFRINSSSTFAKTENSRARVCIGCAIREDQLWYEWVSRTWLGYILAARTHTVVSPRPISIG